MKNKILSYVIVLCMLFGIMVMPVGAEIQEGYFTYYVTDEKEAIIVSVNPQISGNVEVPSATEWGYSVIGIDSQAFDSCMQDFTLSLPKTLEWIDGYAFARCPSVSLELDSENPYFELVDGILYSEDMTKLIYASPKLTGNFVTPDSVTTVCDGAFVFSQFDSITISDNVTTMMTRAYRGEPIWEGSDGCYGRVFANALCKHIIIGPNVQELGRCCVYVCPQLEDVTILGMETAFEDDFVIDDENGTHAKLLFYPGSLAEQYAKTYNGATGYIGGGTSSGSGGSSGDPVHGGGGGGGSGSAATSGACGDNATWTYDEWLGTLEIRGTGKLYEYDDYYSYPWSFYTPVIEKIIIDEGITEIPQRAFSEQYWSLEKVYIPSTVTKIGEYAFYNNENLQRIYFAGNAPEISGKSISYNENLIIQCVYPGTSGWYDSEYYDSTDGTWYGHILVSEPTSAPRHTSPTNLRWNETQNGVISFDKVYSCGGSYIIKILLDSEMLEYEDEIGRHMIGVVEYDELFDDRIDIDLSEYFLKSGEYSVLIIAEGDDKYLDSVAARSEIYNFVLPNEKLAIPTELQWLDNGVLRHKEVPNAGGYMYKAYYEDEMNRTMFSGRKQPSAAVGYTEKNLSWFFQKDDLKYITVKAIPYDIEAFLQSDATDFFGIDNNQGGTVPVEPEKIQQNIGLAAYQVKTYGDDSYQIEIIPDAESGLTDFTYESSNPDVASIDENGTITIKSVGLAQITVKQAGNDEYAPFEYTQLIEVIPLEVEVSSIDFGAKTAQLNGILEADKNDVELDFDKLQKTVDEVVTDDETKTAKITVKNFVLKGDKAKNYVVTTDSITDYFEISKTNEEDVETTEGVTADIYKTEDTIIISNIDISAFDAEEQEKIVFDTTKGDEKISAFSIIAGGIQAMAQAEVPCELALTDKNDKTATFEFDKDALSAIAEGITGNISIKVETPDNTDLNDAQQVQTTALASKNPAVYSFNIENGNTDFGTGKATVKVYYDKTGTGNVTAVYLKEDGTIEAVPAVYDNETKTVKLTLSHFSDYAIYTEPAPVHHSSGGGGGVSSYTVKLDTNGGEELKNISIKKGQAIGTIPTPAKKGYVFDGWYADKELTKAYSGDEKVTESTTLYAGWKVDPIRQMTLTIGDKNATVFGEETANDVAPIIRNDRTMLPIRFIAEALGAEVIWDSATKVVTITNDDIEIKITIDQGVAIVNGEEIALDSPAFIESDRTFLPLRFVSENLGAEVDWVEETRQVVITKPIEE